MASATLVAISNAPTNTSPSGPTKQRENHIHAQQSKSNPPSLPKTKTTHVYHFRRRYQDRGLSETAVSIILSSWRTSSQKQYTPYINKWHEYCHPRKLDPLSATVEEGVNFLAELYSAGIGYSGLNTARSALSTGFNLPKSETFGAHLLVSRFMKGVFETRPTLPRYSEIWHVNIAGLHKYPGFTKETRPESNDI